MSVSSGAARNRRVADQMTTQPHNAGERGQISDGAWTRQGLERCAGVQRRVRQPDAQEANRSTNRRATAPESKAMALVTMPSALEAIQPLAPTEANKNTRPPMNAMDAGRLSAATLGSNPCSSAEARTAWTVRSDHASEDTIRHAALAMAVPAVMAAGRVKARRSAVPAPTARMATAAVKARPPRTALVEPSWRKASARESASLTSSVENGLASRVRRPRQSTAACRPAAAGYTARLYGPVRWVTV